MLGLDFGGDVSGDTAIAQEFPCAIEQGRAAGLDPDGLAIGKGSLENEAPDGLMRLKGVEIALPALVIAINAADFGTELADKAIRSGAEGRRNVGRKVAEAQIRVGL